MTVPSARILTYGYDAHINSQLDLNITRNTVGSIACDFQIALEAVRQSEPSRPMLFIAHSLGGIVVKEMLERLGRSQPSETNSHSLFQSTIGIMFFGTPNNGPYSCGILQHIAERVTTPAGIYVDKQTVRTLLPSAESLRKLGDNFSLMAQKQNWIVQSFKEHLGVKHPHGHNVSILSRVFSLFSFWSKY